MAMNQTFEEWQALNPGSTVTDWMIATAASPSVSLDPIVYYASADGGKRAFNITSRIVQIAGEGEQELAALVNPEGSGKDIYLDLGEFQCSTNTEFTRWRGSTLTFTAAPFEGTNMGGGETASVARMYPAGTYTAENGQIAKTAHIGAYIPYFANIGGRTVLRPGQSLRWTILNRGTIGGGFTASVYFEYWELDAS